MIRKASAVLEKPAGTQTCHHHWLIEPAYGLTSNGVCKYCGEKKQFLNVVQDFAPDPVKGKKNGDANLLNDLIEEEEEKDAELDDED
jgi:hypothetical protein